MKTPSEWNDHYYSSKGVVGGSITEEEFIIDIQKEAYNQALIDASNLLKQKNINYPEFDLRLIATLIKS